MRSHVGIEGNEGADALANEGALMPAVPERDWDNAIRGLAQEEVRDVRTTDGQGSRVKRASFAQEWGAKRTHVVQEGGPKRSNLLQEGGLDGADPKPENLAKRSAVVQARGEGSSALSEVGTSSNSSKKERTSTNAPQKAGPSTNTLRKARPSSSASQKVGSNKITSAMQEETIELEVSTF